MENHQENLQMEILLNGAMKHQYYKKICKKNNFILLDLVWGLG